MKKISYESPRPSWFQISCILLGLMLFFVVYAADPMTTDVVELSNELEEMSDHDLQNKLYEYNAKEIRGEDPVTTKNELIDHVKEQNQNSIFWRYLIMYFSLCLAVLGYYSYRKEALSMLEENEGGRP